MDRIVSVRKLGALIKASPAELKFLSKSSNLFYRPFIDRSGSKPRQIDQPTGRLKVIQKRLYRLLFRDFPFPEYVQAGVKNRSTETAVAGHIGQKAVLKIDIQDCFGSIHRPRVISALIRRLGYGRKVAELVGGLVTRNGYLPQGASTSMFIANLVLLDSDETLLSIVPEHGVKHYTRWVDDMVFSGDHLEAARVIGAVADALRALGLKPHRKPEKRRLMTRGHRQEALGIVLNRRPNLSKTSRSRIRSAVHHLHTDSTEREFQSVQGQLRYLKRFAPQFALGLQDRFIRVADSRE
jgi:RNA-directed DNA polymerase